MVNMPVLNFYDIFDIFTYVGTLNLILFYRHMNYDMVNNFNLQEMRIKGNTNFLVY